MIFHYIHLYWKLNRDEGFDDYLTKIYDQIKHIHFTTQIKYLTLQSNFTRNKKNPNSLSDSYFPFEDQPLREREIKCIHEHKNKWFKF